MDVVRFGRGLRALRRRRGWRQTDLGAAAGVSRSLIARVEGGRGDRLTVRSLERIAGAVGARVVVRLDFNGEALDRLLDADHASVVEHVVRCLHADGWIVATEVTFSVYGERGSIDVLASHFATATLLVIEVKTVVPDLQAMLAGIDRKARLAPGIARDRGWRAGAVWRVLAIRETRTARRRLDDHGETISAALPARTRDVRSAIRDPAARPLERGGGVWFVSDATQASARHRVPRRREGGDADPRT